jgi:NADPH:quinone reductase-like Zn-dependent oxidoreductase
LAGGCVSVFKSSDRVIVFSRTSCDRYRDCTQCDEADCAASTHIGLDRWGGYAEYMVVPATNVFPIPDNLSFAEAATVIMRHYPTALQLLANKADVKPGQWVLVIGASGGNQLPNQGPNGGNHEHH